MADSAQPCRYPRCLVDGGMLFLAALILGLLILWELSSWPGLILSLQPGTDMAEFLRKAQGLWQGTWPAGRPFFQAPLYNYFLALCLPFVRNLYGILLVQILLFAGSVVLVSAVGRRLGGRRMGLVAGTLLLFYGAAFFYTFVTHSTCTELFFAALFLWTLVAWLQRLRSAEDRSWKDPVSMFWSIGTGLSYGLLCLIRPNFLILAPCLAIFTILRTPRHDRRQAIVLGGLITLVAVFVFLPVVMHNNRHSDRWVFLNTNGGVTFRNSNLEGARVFNYIGTNPPRPMMPITSGRFWKHQAKKALGFWWSVEYPQNANLYLFREQSFFLSCLFLPFGLLAGLFLVGHWLCRDRLLEYWPLLTMFWGYYVSLVFFHITSRYRIPAMPAMVVLAAAALIKLWELYRIRRGRAGIVTILVILITTATLPWMQVVTHTDLHALGMCSMYRQQPKLAAEYFRRSRERVATWDNSIQLAVALANSGQLQQALEIVLALARKHPENPNLAETAAGLLEGLGQMDKAAQIRKLADRQYAEQERIDLILQGTLFFRQQGPKYNPSRPLLPQ